MKKKEKISAHVHTYTAHVSTSYESYIYQQKSVLQRHLVKVYRHRIV